MYPVQSPLEGKLRKCNCNGFAPGTFKVYQRGFLKVAVLKCTKPSLRKVIKEMQSLIELSRALPKFVSEAL